MSERIAMSSPGPLELAQRGVELCRGGYWEGGMNLLSQAATSAQSVELPGVCFGYLGYTTARLGKQYREGLAMCEYAVKVAMCDPEVYLTLARTLLLMKKRSRAIGILNRGLALAPDHAALLEMRLEMGVRRPPVVRFLSRGHPLNRLLGRMRHRSRGL